MSFQHGRGEHVWKKTRQPNSHFILHNCYVGDWVQGKRSGSGEFSYASGAKYTGEWLNNQKHGIGTFVFDNGFTYHGAFVRDAMADTMAGEAHAVICTAALGIARYSAEQSSNLQRVAIRHLAAIRSVYQRYANCAPASPENVYILRHLQLHRLLKDSGLNKHGHSLVQVDKLLGFTPSPQTYNEPLLVRDLLAVLIQVAVALYPNTSPDEALSKYITADLPSCTTSVTTPPNSPDTIPASGSAAAVGGLYMHSPALLELVSPMLDKLFKAFTTAVGAGASIKARQLIFFFTERALINQQLSVSNVLEVMKQDSPHLFEDDDCNLDAELVFGEFVEVVMGCAVKKASFSDSTSDSAIAEFVAKCAA